MNTSSQLQKLIAAGVAVCAVMLTLICALLWQWTRRTAQSAAPSTRSTTTDGIQKVTPTVPDEGTLTASLYAAAKSRLDEMSVDTLSKSESATEVSPAEYALYKKIYGDGTFYDYVREKTKRTKTSHNILRTESLTSPYLGYIVAEFSTTFSPSFIQKEKAQKAELDPSTTTFHKKQFNFAYQGGQWVFKSQESLD